MTVRIGLIGAGGMGRAHLARIANDLSGGEFGKAFAAYAQQQNGVLAHGVFSRFSSILRAGWREKA